jgi:ABC-type sugar transport system ATPase subunit
LLKVLAGVHQPDAGEVRIRDRPVSLDSVRDSQGRGIQVVYQDLALAPDLTIAESMFLGHERMARRWRRLGVIDRKTMGAEAAAAIRRLGVSLPAVDAAIGSLSGGQRQAVAIARAVRWAENVLLMDEPTAALGVRQTEIVTNVIRAAADSGLGVLVISHDMPHMLRTADRIAVLRHGVVVAD